MNCPNCSEALSERGCFCKSCGAQARCRQCKELLEPAAVACVECGTKVGEGNTAIDGAIPAMSLPANRNTITYREDRNSRDFQASLTNDSMESLGGVFNELFSQRGVGRTHQQGTTHIFSKEQPAVDAPKGIPAAPEVNGVASTSNPPAQAPALPPELTRISEIFRANGETLELIENRLKAKSGMDYVRRLTYLFLYAHELHGRQWTPRADLLAVLKEAKVLDPNARSWLKNKKGFRVDPEDRIQLIQGGREEAQKALIEALDQNVTDDWNPDKKVVSKRGPRKKQD
jgi:hypothetical protein